MSQSTQPATTRVSRTLHKSGLTTVLASGPHWGIEVSGNAATGRALAAARASGHAVVTVIANYEFEAMALRNARRVTEVLQAAGYRVEANDEDPSILQVWEPDWERYLRAAAPVELPQ